MNKKIINLSLIFVGLLTISSCGGKNKEKMDKGKSVDSITFDNYIENNLQYEKKTVTINKTDTYQEMIEKLGDTTFHFNANEHGLLPFYETCSEAYTSTIKNDIVGDLTIKDNKIINSGFYKNLADYNESYDLNASTKMYDFSNYYDFFYTSDKKLNHSMEYILTDNTVSTIDDIDYKDKGIYYKSNLHRYNGGKLEVAINLDTLPINKKSDIKFEDDDAFYFNVECSAENAIEIFDTTYVTDDNKMNFNPNSIRNAIDNIYSPTVLDQLFNYYNIAGVLSGNMQLVPEILNIFEYSFELTDKYIIIKNKLNTSLQNYNYIMDNNIYEYPERLEERLKMFEGSYEYTEVWIDYINAKLYTNEVDGYEFYRIGYAYYKKDCINKYTHTCVWGETSTYPDKELLESIGAYGKTYEKKYQSEIHFESMPLVISQEEKDKIKTNFIAACKENNVVDKYGFKLKN